VDQRKAVCALDVAQLEATHGFGKQSWSNLSASAVQDFSRLSVCFCLWLVSSCTTVLMSPRPADRTPMREAQQVDGSTCPGGDAL